MREFLKKKLLENVGFIGDDELAETASTALENFVYNKQSTQNVYRNSISGLGMEILRANKASTAFDYQSVIL